MSDVSSRVYSRGEEVHGIYASKHVKLVDNICDTLDKEINYIEKTLSDHHNSISNNNTFMNTTRDLLVAHTSNKDNPHNTTKAQVGLGNCDNTADNVKEVLSAAKWTVSRTLTIGNAGKNVNGLANITWSLAEIGAVNKAGDTMSGPLRSTYATNTWIEGNKGNALLSSMVQGGSYVAFTRYPSKNGVFCVSGYDKQMHIVYTSNSNIQADLNSFSKDVIILDESGNSAFPGNVGAVSFTGPVTGNATSATKWNTARTLTIGSCNRSVDGTANISWPLNEIGAVNKNGDTMYGSLIMKKPSYVSSSDGTSAASGYILVARITIKSAYATCPIEFEITNRHIPQSMKIAITFSNEKTDDPLLSSFTHYNSTEGAYLHKSAASIWDIYVHKNDQYDNISITRYNTNIKYMDGMIDISHPNTQVSELPSGYIKSTKLLDASVADKLAVPRKIGNATFDGTKNISVEEIGYDKNALMADVISMIYPVGSIKMTYDNINPGTYLKNTTWELTSKGAYIRGVNPSDGNLNTAKAGGSLEVDISHSHYIAAHTHTANHTHYIEAHNHYIEHAHSINGHSHTVNNHSHSTGGHALTGAEMPSHNHTAAQGNAGDHTHIVRLRGGAWIGDDGVPGHNGERIGTSVYTLTTKNTIESSGGHNHSISIGLSGSGYSHYHGDTGGSAPGTNSVGLSTNNGGGYSGGTALNTNEGGGTTSGTAMDTNSGGGIRYIEPTYQTLYCWRRIA